MRVISGTLGGRIINGGDKIGLRPTSSRVREALFNSLYSLDAIARANVIDLFAGTGSLGIEALSRGAKHVVFVENDAHARAVLHQNIVSLDLEDQTRVVPADATSYLAHLSGYQLALLDPPYSFDAWPALLNNVRESVVAIESNRAVEVPDSWHTHWVRRYGGTVLTVCFAPATKDDIS